MNMLAESSRAGGSPEMFVGIAGATLLAGYFLWSLFRWIFRSPVSPDPWDKEVSEQLSGPDCTPLCHHCLAEQSGSRDFCQNCGAPVGAYTNFLPYPYLFSLGHLLRIGTTERYKRSALTVSGFFLLSIAEYVIFAPFYWFKFLKNLRAPGASSSAEPPAEGEPALPGGG